MTTAKTATIPTASVPKAKLPAAKPTPITGKRRKLSGNEFKAARDNARSLTGYGPSSPIWGKRIDEVLLEIDELLDDTSAKAVTTPLDISNARTLIGELRSRLLTGKLISQAASVPNA